MWAARSLARESVCDQTRLISTAFLQELLCDAGEADSRMHEFMAAGGVKNADAWQSDPHMHFSGKMGRPRGVRRRTAAAPLLPHPTLSADLTHYHTMS